MKGSAGKFQVELEHYTGTLDLIQGQANSADNKNQQKTSHMSNQPAPVQLSVVPKPEAQKEIENTLDAPRRIAEAIENFEKQRADAEAELIRSLRKDLAAATFNIERAVEQ
jgi:hypothetical protein